MRKLSSLQLSPHAHANADLTQTVSIIKQEPSHVMEIVSKMTGLTTDKGEEMNGEEGRVKTWKDEGNITANIPPGVGGGLPR